MNDNERRHLVNAMNKHCCSTEFHFVQTVFQLSVYSAQASVVDMQFYCIWSVYFKASRWKCSANAKIYSPKWWATRHCVSLFAFDHEISSEISWIICKMWWNKQNRQRFSRVKAEKTHARSNAMCFLLNASNHRRHQNSKNTLFSFRGTSWYRQFHFVPSIRALCK